MSGLRQIALSLAGSVALFAGVQGCASNHPDEVGANAVMETSGDKVVTWSASANGKVTVFDENSDKIVYGGQIMTGQGIRVDVDNNRVLLDSQTVSENSLHRGDQYRIYFEPIGVVTRSQTIESNTVQTSHTP